MKTIMKAPKKVTKKMQQDIDLLKEIVELNSDLSTIRASVTRMTERRDLLLQEAADRKIERAGNFKLVCKTRSTSKIDMAAIEKLLTPDQFLQCAHVTIRDAGQFLSKKQIDACTTKEIGHYYKVESIHKPEGKI